MTDNAPGERDQAIATTEDAEKRARGARLFDIRRLIGALFVIYGIVLVIVGLTDGKAEIAKASGVHINLWTGLGMLVFGILMLIWAFGRPVIVDEPPRQPDKH
ncbi:MAG: hypothetical protein QOD91_1887 [Frankiales bacterium]|nr:hypothetical protein [Frankiales bacterium]